jgi:hypothetical protein
MSSLLHIVLFFLESLNDFQDFMCAYKDYPHCLSSLCYTRMKLQLRGLHFLKDTFMYYYAVENFLF